MEIKEIQELIRFVAKSGVSEVEIEKEGFKIHIKTTGQHQASVAVAPQVVHAQVLSAPTMVESVPASTPSSTPAAAPTVSTGTQVKAPMVGTFYRSAGPDKDPFVKVGDRLHEAIQRN